jgi:hypothetical protein
MPNDEPDTRLELAYDAGEKRLALQLSTLGNVRTRANSLLATAALFTSFAAGLGLINTDRTKGPVLQPYTVIALFVIFVLLGLTVLYITTWPAPGVSFGPPAQRIMEKYDQGDDEASIRKSIIDGMIKAACNNEDQIRRRQSALRAAAVLLMCEIALLVGEFWWSR